MRCAVCGKLFAGDTSFQMHRVGEFLSDVSVREAAQARRCLTPAEMREIGLKRDHRGRWCRLAPIITTIDEEKKEVA
jgi:hypothetical protein